jgi:hypothetical protein
MYTFGETVVSDSDTTVRSGGSEFSAALQFALDRRDNGGDAATRPQ